mgnify:CR=1 FL=1|jgi:hypothetical protein|tara:strand:+ start:224 stop:430 length:207 start_codon:yes stop_codon:yes gene_type:complete
MKSIKINDTGYVRDIDSKAVLNTDRKALENYKLSVKKKQEEIDDINNMKRDISELKEMIKTLLGKQNG